MTTWVVHIDMDAFFASCEQLTRPTLQGRPVLVGGTSGRGVVAGCSYEARAFGAHSAQPMRQARALCGYSAVTVTPRKKLYSTVSRAVFHILDEEADVVEQLSIDEGFLRVDALNNKTAEEVEAWGRGVQQRIIDTLGLAASLGIGPGKQAAKIASGLAKPYGVFVIPHDKLHEILDPLPVRKLWGIGPVAERRLHELGVETIKDFASMHEKEVRLIFGANGLALWQIAHGDDTREVTPRAIAKQVSSEFTYPADLTTDDHVTAAISRAAQSALARLAVDGRGAKTVTVKTKTAEFVSTTRSHTLSYATDDPATLEAIALSLARPVSDTGPLRLVGVSFSGLDPIRQGVFFPELDTRRVEHSSVDDYEVGTRGRSIVEETTHTENPHHPEADEADDQSSGLYPPGSPLAELAAVLGSTTPEGEQRFHVTQDVSHPEHGHGWIQGLGHGVMTIRFETRITGKGPVRSFPIDDESIQPADPCDSLAWPEELWEWIRDNNQDAQTPEDDASLTAEEPSDHHHAPDPDGH